MREDAMAPGTPAKNNTPNEVCGLPKVLCLGVVDDERM